jgi:DNA-binding CsgD family transcriptional regulator
MNQMRVAALNTDFDDAVLGRLRAVIDSLDEGDTARDEEAERVLMDVELDGRRYLLVRMAPAVRNNPSLSPREIEIVRLVAEGHPNKVIAAVLDISAWTVCTHVRRVFMKLGVTSRAAMVARAAELVQQTKVPLRAPILRSPSSPLPGEPRRKVADSLASTRHAGEKINVRDVTLINPRDSVSVRLRR